MHDKKTMTLNLTELEMAALEDFARRKDLSKTAVIRQALRLYQLVDDRVGQGDRLVLEDSIYQRKAEIMVLA